MDKGTVQEGESSSPKFEGCCSKKGGGEGGEGGQTDLKFFGWAKVKRGEVNISGWGCYPGSHYELSHTFLCSHSLGQKLMSMLVTNFRY